MENTTQLQYKCPCCGGYIEYDGRLGKMKCPYCDTEFDPETLKNYDEDISGDKADEMDWSSDEDGKARFSDTDGMNVYVCSSCGGEIITEETTAASSCPFCGNPVIFKSQLSGEFKPDCIIPFKLSKDDAKQALKKHLEGRRLLPKVFKSENHIDEIKGVYVPFWLFDTDIDARVRYRATTTRCWSDSEYNYTETNYFDLARAGHMGFDNIPVDGSQKMPDDLMESLEPFDFSQAVEFSTAYLSGYLADKYDVSAQECTDRVNERVKGSAESELRGTVSPMYDIVAPESSSVRLSEGRHRYALFPVWLLNTTWNGNKYTFAMNGQTGKFVGDLPVDNKLAAKYFAGFFAAGSAIAYGLIWLIMH